MTALKRNIIANFLGKGWSALMGLAFIPLYVQLMGIESFGLVGLFTTIQGVFVLLDLGLSTTLNRELARLSAQPGRAQNMRDLVRTLEVVYWGLAIFIGIAVFASSGPIARDWIKAESLSVSTVQESVMLMGLVMVFQWPLAFYSGGLLGLQRQVMYSGLNAGWYTLRFAGAVVVLWLISPSILAFFIWQVIASASSTALTALALWHNLPVDAHRPCFRPSVLSSVWRFAAGLSGISVTVLVLTQVDKIVLSKLLPLESFGYYSLAWMVANALTTLISPIFVAVFPSFSQRVALGDIDGLRQLYHRACQLMSVVVLPAMVVVVLFASEILLLWTRSQSTVENTHLLVSILIVGTALNGLMNLPYALQLAHGWTSLTLHTNMISIIALVPLLILAASRFGAVGAATIWVLLNSGYILVQLQLMHRKLLPGEQWRWYVQDVGLPLAAALMVGGLGRWLIHEQSASGAMLISILVVLSTAYMAAAVAAPYARHWMQGQVAKWRVAYGT